MNVCLSNYGWMVVRNLSKAGNFRLGVSPENDLLFDMYTGLSAPYQDTPLHKELLEKKLIELAPETLSREELQLRYRRNPFEYVGKVIFEFTTFCNFNCDHCYNAQVPRMTENDPRKLIEAAHIFLDMGIRRFDFIGGEVSRYGTGWLDVAEAIRSRGQDIFVSLYTNGWWLEREKFQAAGCAYADTRTYLEDLKRRGVSHITFSLDGPDEAHDESRHHAGLYQQIMRGFETVKRAGLIPRVSLLRRPEWSDAQIETFLADIAMRLYEFEPDTPPRKRALRLALDSTNAISNFIDIGNGAGSASVQFPILDGYAYPPLYCRNFYRLSPALTIKANGELATCRLSQAGEGYGNLHDRPLVDIINRFEEAFVYQLHARRRLEDYLPLVDRSLFGIAFTHLCSLRAIVTMLARRLNEQGVSFDDAAAVRRINQEVALLTGYAKRQAL